MPRRHEGHAPISRDHTAVGAATALPVPHADGLPARLLKSVRRRALAFPRTPGQARKRAKQWFDLKVVGRPHRREALVRRWPQGAKVASRLPGVDRKVSEHTVRIADGMARKGASETALALLAATEAGLTGDAARLPVTARRMVLELDRGVVPREHVEVTRRLGELADEAYAQQDYNLAAARLQDAFNLAFHRLFHFEDIPSPYAADPETFLAPLRRSTAFQKLLEPSGQRRRSHAAVDANRPYRVLVTTVSNFNFAGGIIDDLVARPDTEVQTLDLRTIPDGPWRASPVDLVANRLRQSDGIPMAVPSEARALFDWADTVFVEWGHRAMVWASLLPDLDARVVARLHSYEAFTPFPFTTDWSGIDDLVFVCGHIRALTEAGVPGVANGPTLHTIANRNVLADYRRPKRKGAERTVALIGWGQVVKDPLWALDVLEELHKTDPTWRLRLVGGEFAADDRLNQSARDYRDRLYARITQLGSSVLLPGYTKDVAHSLRRAGVILSSSLREGTHEALIQGAASGALPVVRNWPFVARWGGPHTMFPSDWVVTTPAQAAHRILAAAEGDLFEHTRDPADWVTQHYDWSVVGPQLLALLVPRSAPTTERTP